MFRFWCGGGTLPATPLRPRDSSFQEKARGHRSKRQTDQRMWKVEVKLVVHGRLNQISFPYWLDWLALSYYSM